RHRARRSSRVRGEADRVQAAGAQQLRRAVLLHPRGSRRQAVPPRQQAPVLRRPQVQAVSGAAMKDVWDRIHRWVRDTAPEVLESLRPGAAEGRIRAAEEAMGVTLPEEVKAAYRIHDGQAGSTPPAFLHGWEWMSLDGMLSMWRCHKDLLDNGTFSDEV